MRLKYYQLLVRSTHEFVISYNHDRYYSYYSLFTSCEVIKSIFLGSKLCTVKPVYNDHPRDPKIVAVVDRWSLFGGHLCYKRSNWDLKTVAVEERWSLFGGGR